MGNLVTFRGSHLREPIGVSASSRRGPTLRINSGTSNAARWSHLRHIVFSTCFLPAGIIHLVGNMYFLLVFGDNVEDFLRPLRYLTLIALAAFIGDLAHIAVDPRSQIPCIGASGGSAGAITFYALNFPRVRLEFLMRWGFVWFRWIRLPAWSVFVLWIFFQLIGAWKQRPA